MLLLSSQTPRHPGEILEKEFLSRLPGEATQADIADRLGISRPRLSLLLRGKRSVTPDTALRLAQAFGTTPEFWMKAQAQWDLDDARRCRKRMREVEQITPLLREARVGDRDSDSDETREADLELAADYRDFLESEGLLLKATRFTRIRAQLEALDLCDERPRRPLETPRLPPRDQWFIPGLPFRSETASR